VTEALLLPIGVAVAGAVVLGALCLIKLAELARRASLTSEAVSQLLRVETDLIKKAGDDQCSALRQEFGARLDQGIKVIDVRVAAIGQKLNDDMATMRDEAGKNREGLRHTVEAKLDDATGKQGAAARELREELNASFRRMQLAVGETLTTLGSQQKERLDTTAVALATFGEKNERAQETLRKAVEDRLDAIRVENAQKLDEMRQTVDEKLQSTLETRLGESFNRVVEQLTRVHEGIGEMKNLAANVGDLKNVLTNVKIRGTFGEVQLSLLLEEFLAPGQYACNVAIKPNSSERVEFAIKYRVGGDGEELLLPVDAKFPRDDYEHLLEASEAGDAPLMAHFRKQLEMRIKACAKDIRDKYIDPPTTTPFAILFLPTEGLYAEVLRQPGLFEFLQHEYRVTLAGPTTFAAILNAFQMNFRSVAIAKRSNEVWKLLGAVRTEFSRYNEVVGRIEKQLATAATSVENLGRRTRVMTRTLKTVEIMPDDGTAQKLLGLTPDALADEDETRPSFADLSGSEIVLPSVAAE
jgi:DNA recombination protein RmuC